MDLENNHAKEMRMNICKSILIWGEKLIEKEENIRFAIVDDVWAAADIPILLSN